MIALSVRTKDCIRSTVASIVIWFGRDPFAPTASANVREDILHGSVIRISVVEIPDAIPWSPKSQLCQLFKSTGRNISECEILPRLSLLILGRHYLRDQGLYACYRI